MQALVLLGHKRDPEKGPSVVCLYAGLDGVALEKAAAEAAETRSFSQIQKLTNPQGTPMPIDPTPMKSSGIPENVIRKAAKPAEFSKAPSHITKQEDSLRKSREGKFKINDILKQPPLPPKTPAALRKDGPTVNEFVAGGGSVSTYPPVGFEAKPEAFDQSKVDSMISKAAQSEKRSGPPPKQTSTEPDAQVNAQKENEKNQN